MALLEGEPGVRERQVLEVERPQEPGVAAVRLRAQHAGGELARGVLGARHRERGRALRPEHRDGAIRGHAREPFREGLRVNAAHPVADPHDLGIRRRLEEAADAVEMGAPVRQVRLRPEGAHPLQHRGRVGGPHVGGPVREADHRERAPLAARRLDPLDREVEALAPVVGGREAVVDEEEEGPPARIRGGRVPHRPRGGQDQEGREHEP
jgi:hypothetical protein